MANTQTKLRKFHRLTIQDRDLIEIRYGIDKRKLSEIAKELGRPLSTVLREISGKPRCSSKMKMSPSSKVEMSPPTILGYEHYNHVTPRIIKV